MRHRPGIVLVEVLLVTVLIGIWVAALAAGAFRALESSSANDNRNKALSLVTEGVEAVRSIRNDDFANLTNGNYILQLTGNEWTLTNGTEQIDQFLRSVTISDFNGDTKQVDLSVNWQETGTFNKSISVSSLLTDWQKIIATGGDWTVPLEGTIIDDGGSSAGTRIHISGQTLFLTSRNGTGEILTFDITNPTTPVLLDVYSGVSGDPWDLVVVGDYAYVTSNSNSREITILDVSDPSNISYVGRENLSGTNDAYSIIHEGDYLYVTSQGGRDITVLNITNPTNPSVEDTLNVNSWPYVLVKSGNYLYLGSRSNTQEVQVIDVTDPTNISLAGSVGVTGDNNSTSIYVEGNRLYLGRNNGDFYIFDLTNPIAPSNIGFINLGNDINGISKDGNFMFIGTEDNSAEFVVLDVTNEASPVIFGSINLSADLEDAVYYPSDDIVFGTFRNGTDELIVIEPS